MATSETCWPPYYRDSVTSHGIDDQRVADLLAGVASLAALSLPERVARLDAAVGGLEALLVDDSG